MAETEAKKRSVPFGIKPGTAVIKVDHATTMPPPLPEGAIAGSERNSAGTKGQSIFFHQLLSQQAQLKKSSAD